MICTGNIITFKIIKDVLKLPFPVCYRVITGANTETKLFAISKINATDSSFEIIISPIQPAKWKNIYNIEIIAENRNSLDIDILELFEKNKIKILEYDILTTIAERKLHFKGMLDISLSINDFNLDSNHKVDVFIENEIIQKFKKINLDRNKEYNKQIKNRTVSVKCKKNSFLSVNCPKYDSENKINDERKAYFLSDKYESLEVSKGHLNIREDILNDLKLQGRKEIQGTVVSDTEEKYLKIQFLNKDQKLLYLKIKHSNIPDSKFDFCKYISWRGMGNIDIISCDNGLEDNKATIHWNALIDITKNQEAYLDLINPQKWLEYATQSGQTVKIEDIQFQYTKNLDKKRIEKKLRPKQLKIKMTFRDFIKKFSKDIIYSSIIMMFFLIAGIHFNWFSLNNLKNNAVAIFTGISVIIYNIYYGKVTFEVVRLLFNKIRNMVKS
jgi:hypothetical protein